jgi:hypothetical protein
MAKLCLRQMAEDDDDDDDVVDDKDVAIVQGPRATRQADSG